MFIETEEINCNSGEYARANINRRYEIVKVIYNRSDSGNHILKQIKNKGLKLADKVNEYAASKSYSVRNKDALEINGISGSLAEYSWLYYLNYLAQDSEFVRMDDVDSSINQKDLIVNSLNSTIEVRSSFVRNGIKFALCNHKYMFDVLGPYTNIYKPNEEFKDYYVRVLYPFKQNYQSFWNYFNQNTVEVYLTGGATLNMMRNKNLYILKSLREEDAFAKTESEYRVIPFSNACDTLQIADCIIHDRQIEK